MCLLVEIKCWCLYRFWCVCVLYGRAELFWTANGFLCAFLLVHMHILDSLVQEFKQLLLHFYPHSLDNVPDRYLAIDGNISNLFCFIQLKLLDLILNMEIEFFHAHDFRLLVLESILGTDHFLLFDVV